MSTLLADMPDLYHRVLVTHVRGADGRCRECPGVPWPCELQQIAAEADRLGAPAHHPRRTAA
ncbi:MAG: hypothetical protein AB7I38_15880 [Dehalococcoidia bacterium]